jgi:hypothetical protein
MYIFGYFFWVSDPLCLSTTLLTGMTGISLHMQWPLTAQSHGSASQREQFVFRYGSNSTPLTFLVIFPQTHPVTLVGWPPRIPPFK